MKQLSIITILFAQLLFFSGCMSVVSDVSRKDPYKAFAGKVVVAKENGSIWINNQESYAIRPHFLRLDSFGEIPSYMTEVQKVADVPIGTRIYVESIKHKRVESEVMGYNSILALCTVTLPDGKKLKFQMNWEELDPDSNKWGPLPPFELMSK
jgi:uncharacterized protein YceK